MSSAQEALRFEVPNGGARRQPPNTVMQPTSTFAAHGVLRPPCSLRMLAADYHVGRTEDSNALITTAALHRGQRAGAVRDCDQATSRAKPSTYLSPVY